MEIKDNDFPSFFRLTDKYSSESQSTYLKWIRIELFVLVIAAGISLFPLDKNIHGQYLAMLSTIMFVIGIGITVHIKNSKFEDAWYIGRALAESIKSLTWKYMTNAEPFISSLGQKDVDDRFIEILKEIFEANRDFKKIIYKDDDGQNITAKMREIRQLAFIEKKEIYLKFRITDQLNWYKSKSDYNKKQSNRLFWMVILLQGAALLYSLYLIINPAFFNSIPLITTLTVAVLTWLQIKQYQELSQSYAVAANDINLILSQEPYIDTEQKLETFIADAETAFSREHTIWIARRDVFSYKN